MKKKIIFLDGDGTLWYPKDTKRTKKPHWIYHDPEIKNNYLEHLELTPKIKETLKEFNDKGIYLVVVSANPNSEDVAIKEIEEKLNYFELSDSFHSVCSSDGNNSQGKSKVILDILNSLNIAKEDALMIGDSFYYDYLPAKDIGVDAFWIKNNVCKLPEIMPDDLHAIDEISDILELLE